MGKELEALEELKQLKEFILKYFKNGLDRRFIIGSFDIIEKELKALEIAKSKEINIHALLLHLKRFDSPSGYNALVGEKYKLTQEEYDLLKEVLL